MIISTMSLLDTSSPLMAIVTSIGASYLQFFLAIAPLAGGVLVTMAICRVLRRIGYSRQIDSLHDRLAARKDHIEQGFGKKVAPAIIGAMKCRYGAEQKPRRS
ncbi:hypothetical protein BZY95_06930 [Billgrantia desiderata SP1]|uniref:hypothetical protein n=1 Tax=Billgrantia desiderata TaxID=52021 RepID=UPI000A3A7A6F|nr:hypothetical protein [Halomonas desiderata]OUE43986.1 hypothetical protein BZY95_06930 [Halomonas desiderata SP1]